MSESGESGGGGGGGGEQVAYAARELRAFLEDETPRENEVAYRHAGLVEDEDIQALLSFLESEWDAEDSEELPYYARDSKLYQQLLRSAGTRRLTRAVSKGNIGPMKNAVGQFTDGSDMSGVEALSWLSKKLQEAALVWYLFGHMGNGKTDFAALLAQLFHRFNPEASIGTNVESLREKDVFIPSFPKLEKWLQETEGRKLMIFDEASSHASGYSDNAAQARQNLGVMVKLIRKYDGNLLIIGHTGKDLHPDVKRLATCIHKEDLKKATVYRSVDGQGEGQGQIKKLHSIPPTSWTYDTKEDSDWSWGKDSKYLRIWKLNNVHGISQKDLASLYDTSRSTIANWVKKGEKETHRTQ